MVFSGFINSIINLSTQIDLDWDACLKKLKYKTICLAPTKIAKGGYHV